MLDELGQNETMAGRSKSEPHEICNRLTGEVKEGIGDTTVKRRNSENLCVDHKRGVERKLLCPETKSVRPTVHKLKYRKGNGLAKNHLC